MNISQNLNLARKWRSKNFDQIIGQDLCVRILKNALYLNSFFPVYLFSGQRGCGKTSTARVFSAAINCEQLSNFQKDPKKYSIPCLECMSCKAMQNGNHPDFIEIDAASHTGVDNVRQIIDASSFLPLMSRKKIYLIDEVHMLSKAAFNAFLKILEEPPSSVVFILATTDVQKVIETVRSRSFQLFFTSVQLERMLEHLENICKQESIDYESAGLETIIRESEGSVRDAINLLEQVRFSSPVISKAAVLNVLGHLSDDYLFTIYKSVICKENPQDLLKFLDEIKFSSYSADYIWSRVFEIFRATIRIKHGVNIAVFERLEDTIQQCSLERILSVAEQFYTNEFLFLKTVNKHTFLELLFLRIITESKMTETKINKSESNQSFSNNKPEIKIENNQSNSSTIEEKTPLNLKESNSSDSNLWQQFISQLKEKNDPLLNSVFTQAQFVKFDQEIFEVSIAFAQKNVFFKELIDDTQNSWIVILQKVFGEKAKLKAEFSSEIVVVEKPIEKKVVSEQSNSQSNTKSFSRPITKKEIKVDVSDTQKWTMANNLMQNFSGTITEIQEEADE